MRERTRSHFWGQTRALIRSAAGLLRAGGSRLLWFILVSQLVIALLAVPLLGAIFRRALNSLGTTGLDFGLLDFATVSAFAPAWIFAIAVLAFWAVALQFGALLLFLNRRRDVQRHTASTLWGATTDIARVWKKLLRPSSLPLIGYLFFFIPLSGFGFGSVFQQNISLPLFVSDELKKSGAGIAILTVFFGLIAFANLRLALTMPIFVLTNATGGQALRLSVKLTRRMRGVQLALAVASVMVLAVLCMGMIVAAAMSPVLLADAWWPAAAPVAAALCLGAAQLAAVFVSGLTVAAIAGILLLFVDRHRDAVPYRWSYSQHEGAPGQLRAGAGYRARGTELRETESRGKKSRGGVLLGSVLAFGALVLGLGNLPVIEELGTKTHTLVLSHRGYAPGGVENTIGGLEAAAEIGADLVEIDVMQAKDGGFVVMHDAELTRLAGNALRVKDLTVEELTQITVRNQFGKEDFIPDLESYIVRAGELGMPLLIEIKMSGAETEDHVDLLVNELERLGALENHLYHSLDAPSVARLKELHPELVVGYTMAFAADQAPSTPADFIVVEQWTASERVQRSAHEAKLGFMVWTVNDEAGTREHLRRGADGIVTDRPDLVLAERTQIAEQQGVAATLFDALQRSVALL